MYVIVRHDNVADKNTQSRYLRFSIRISGRCCRSSTSSSSSSSSGRGCGKRLGRRHPLETTMPFAPVYGTVMNNENHESRVIYSLGRQCRMEGNILPQHTQAWYVILGGGCHALTRRARYCRGRACAVSARRPHSPLPNPPLHAALSRRSSRIRPATLDDNCLRDNGVGALVKGNRIDLY